MFLCLFTRRPNTIYWTENRVSVFADSYRLFFKLPFPAAISFPGTVCTVDQEPIARHIATVLPAANAIIARNLGLIPVNPGLRQYEAASLPGRQDRVNCRARGGNTGIAFRVGRVPTLRRLHVIHLTPPIPSSRRRMRTLRINCSVVYPSTLL